MFKLAAAAVILFASTGATATAQAVPHATGMVHTAQVDLAYETFGTLAGTNIPVIAVNGGPGLSHAYMMRNNLWQRVGRTRLVVLYDQRGTGGSQRLAPGAPQTMAAQVADLEALRAQLRLERIALVGDSYGGFLCMAYAAAHPEHVERLVLSDSPGPKLASMVHLLPQVFPDIEQEDAEQERKLGPDSDAAAQASLRNHFRMIFYSPQKRDQYLAHMGDLGYQPTVARAVSRSASQLDLSASLPTFHFPVLVLNGRYDMNVAPLEAWRLAHAIPGAKLVFFEQSSHLPAYEEEDRYQQVLEGFLEAEGFPNAAPTRQP